MTTRRLAALSAAAMALVLGACSASSGVSTAPETSLEGLGVLPSQVPLEASEDAPGVIPSSIPTSILVDDARTMPEITDPRVFMEGDSVLRAMAIGDPDAIDYYVATLGWDVSVDAQDGRFTDEGIARLLERRSTVGQVVVLMLGNNYDGDQVAFADQLIELLNSFPDVREFVMFTVPLYREDRVEVNDALRTAARFDPRLVLIDWERMSREIPGALSDDRLHPTPYGAELLAQAVGLTLGKAPGAGPDVTLPVFGSTTRPSIPAGTDTNRGETTRGPATPAAAATTTTAARRTTVATASTGAPTTTRVASTTLPASSSTTSASTVPTTVATTAAPTTPTTAVSDPPTTTAAPATTQAPVTTAPPAPPAT